MYPLCPYTALVRSPGELGRLARANGLRAVGQRVGWAGVAGLACAEQVAYPRDRLVGNQAARLVEQQDAVEAAEPGTRRFAHAVIVDGCALVGAASAAGFAGHAKNKGSV